MTRCPSCGSPRIAYPVPDGLAAIKCDGTSTRVTLVSLATGELDCGARVQGAK